MLVKIEFRKDITTSDLPTSAEILDLSFTVNFTQSDDAGIVVSNSGKSIVRVISGDYDTVGSELCIGTECFYLVSSDENSLVMLAKYNLYVGRKCTSSSCTSYTNPTGKQKSTMKGYISSSSTWDGIIEYANSEQSASNPANYGCGVAEIHVNNYAEYLEELGAVVIDSGLIGTDELKSLGCYFFILILYLLLVHLLHHGYIRRLIGQEHLQVHTMYVM